MESRTTSIPLVVSATVGVKSNHPLLRERLDLLRRHPEQLAVHVLVVLAIAGSAAVEAAADVGRALAHLDGHLGERPAADLGAGHFGEPGERGELRVAITTIARGLAHAGWNAGALQRQHSLVRVPRRGPATHERIERNDVRQPPREILEA